VASPARARKPKSYRLYKRDRATGREFPKDAEGWRELPYYFRIRIAGSTYVRNLGTNDWELGQKYARAKARELKTAIVANDMAALDRTRLRAPASAKVADLIKAYRNAGVDASADTRAQNIHALRLVISRVYDTDAPETLPVSDINALLARKWFTLAGQAAAAADDQRAANSIKRSANSRFGHARSLFIPRALAAYKDAELVIPACVQDFAGAMKAHRFSRLPRAEYNPPGDKVIQDTLTGWETIEDRDLFLAIGHELAFGLRKGELAQAKWSWWTIRQGYPVLEGTASVKNGSGLVQVRALDPWFMLMKRKAEARGWVGKADDFIIGGNHSNREDSIFRAVSLWLRGLGWQTQKTNHALRAYAGSQIAMKYGIYDAQTWLRHSTVKVTEQHYTAYVKRFKPADVDTLPARWATSATAEPALRILEARA
jgi:integrase